MTTLLRGFFSGSVFTFSVFSKFYLVMRPVVDLRVGRSILSSFLGKFDCFIILLILYSMLLLFLLFDSRSLMSSRASLSFSFAGGFFFPPAMDNYSIMLGVFITLKFEKAYEKLAASRLFGGERDRDGVLLSNIVE